MIKQTCLLPLALLFCLPVFAQTKDEIRILTRDQPIEREIKGGESHTYQITLTAGQFARVVVEQKTVDVALKLAVPDGKQLIESNLTDAGEQESLSAEAATGGEYQLTISAISAATLPGSYRVRLEVKMESSSQDKKRITAERLLDEASKSNQKGAAETAIGKAQKALTLWRELEERYLEAVTNYLIGQAYLSASKYEQALEVFNQALGIWREMKHRRGEGAALNNLGGAYDGLSLYEKAVENYEQALVIRRELKDRRGEAATLSNLGNMFAKLSRFEKAVEYYEQAMVIRREVKDRSGEGNTLSNLGNVHARLSRFEKAVEYFEQALAIRRELKDLRGQGVTLMNLGVAYNIQSRYEKAVEYFEQALAISREGKNRRGEGITLLNLGNAYHYLRRYEKAIEYYEQSLVIRREVKDRSGEGHTLGDLGGAYHQLSRYEKAIEYYEKALAIHREVKDRSSEGNTLSNLGGTYQKLNSHDKAIEHYQLALAIHREVKTREEEASTLYGLAGTEGARGNLVAARIHIEESLKLAEATRAGIVTPESRTSFLAAVQGPYQLYTDILMRQHKSDPSKGLDALAVEVSERQRARSLLDLLTEAGTDLRQGVGSALIERERTLAKQLNDKARSTAVTPEKAAALKLEISQLETDYERAQAAIRKASPHYAALVQPQPLKLKEIQAQLDAETLLLEYALGEDRSYLWAITRDSLTSYELPKGEQIDNDARQVHELLVARSVRKRGESASQRDERVAQAEAKLPAAAASLSQTLLAPVAAQLGNKRLVIVADGALQYIPFAMLPEPRSADLGLGSSSEAKDQKPKSEDQPLIVNHEVVSLPSASALAIQRTELAGRRLAPKMLAVIADPVFDRSDVRFKSPAVAGASDKELALSYNDSRSIEHLAETQDNKPGVTTVKMVIPRLPFTRQEASKLLALTPKNTSFGAIDFQASRTIVLNTDLSQYRYVHFATHGLLDSERPGLSSLVLSMVDSEGKAQDGFLRANDIYNMKLPAELVVLSACQTGLGKEIKGEGLVGLTRGFMYAGAPRVVVSLWNVNDKATAELMTKFYQKMLKQGERPAAALRAAQVEMWKQKRWQSPYYWAAFTLQGEWK